MNGKVDRVDGALNLKTNSQTELLALQAHRLHLRVVLPLHFRFDDDHRGAEVFQRFEDFGFVGCIKDGAADVRRVIEMPLSGVLEDLIHLGQLEEGVEEVLADVVEGEAQRVRKLVIRSLRNARGDAENLQLDGLQLTGLGVDGQQLKLRLKPFTEGVLVKVVNAGDLLLQVVLDGADVGGQLL